MRTNARIPVIALDYSQKDLALKKELMIDYETGDVFVVSAHDKNVIFKLSESIANVIKDEGFDVSNTTIYIEGVGEVSLADIINNMYGSSFKIINEEQAVYLGHENRLDNDSIVNKMGNIQIVGFDEANDLTVPQKYNGVVRWVPMEASGEGGSGEQMGDIVIVEPGIDTVKLTPDPRQKTVIEDGNMYKITMPVAVTDYMHFLWLVEDGMTVPNLTFDPSVHFEYEDDNQLLPDSTTCYFFETWDKGATWMGRSSRFTDTPDVLVTERSLVENYYNKPQVEKLLSWEEDL